MKKIKDLLFSDRGMELVNILFIIAVLGRNSPLNFIAYLAWIVYLVYGIKNTESKVIKVVNSVFIVFAVIMIIVMACALMNII